MIHQRIDRRGEQSLLLLHTASRLSTHIRRTLFCPLLPAAEAPANKYSIDVSRPLIRGRERQEKRCWKWRLSLQRKVRKSRFRFNESKSRDFASLASDCPFLRLLFSVSSPTPGPLFPTSDSQPMFDREEWPDF